ncbi:MAG: LAGLIDADG family homing endonuclease [Thiohalomonadaceae bacterium]
MSRAKDAKMSVTSAWGDLIGRAEHIADETKGGSIYRVQPVDLETFVTSPDYLGRDMWGMSDKQKEFIEAATDFENGITFFVLMVGKGAGKNWACGIAYLYAVYKLLCMHDPHAYLEHDDAKAITLLNVAINALQAKKNFFDPMINTLRGAGRKAFRDFGFDPDTDITTSQVIFPKNIEVISANSKGGGIEGYDVLFGIADEVDDVEFYGVEKILDTLRTSSQSRFKGKEKVVAISYQRYSGSSGKIAQLYSTAIGSAHIYARRYASWEFHPARTREDFQTYFDEDPEKAACIYGSELMGSFVDSWIKDTLRIKNAMNWERKWILDWPLPYDPDEIGSEKWKAKLAHLEWQAQPASEYSYRDNSGVIHTLDPYDLPIRVPGDPNTVYVLCGDPAAGSEKNGGDGYGVTLGHRELVRVGDFEYPRPVIDFSFRFIGRMFPEGQIQMSAMENLISKLKDRYGYNIQYFSFDGWNCQVVGSRVLTPSGYKLVETLKKHDDVVGNKNINKVVETEVKHDIPTKTIKTDIGLEFTVTSNHPLLTKDNKWLLADQLQPGDKLKLFLGDDHFGTTHDPDKALFHGKDENDHVPEWIFGATEESIGMFLSGLYESKGSVVVDINGVKSPHVEYNTLSEKLSKEVQLLLLQLGIKSWRTSLGEDYSILIYGESLELFRNLVGFRSTEKLSKALVTEGSRCNCPEATVTSVEDSVSSIVHMEVDGDHTYAGEGVVNHNSLHLTQWIARTYPGVIVQDGNIVQTKDYTALRDAIFGEAPPTSGQGEKETNGGIDIPWNPVLFEELRNLREDRSKPKIKVDHTSTSTKDIADTVAKLAYITMYAWPFIDTVLHSVGQEPPLSGVDPQMLDRLRTNTASEEDKKVYYEAVASDVVGLGLFKR